MAPKRNDIVNLAAICATMVDFLRFHTTCCLASLHAGPVGCISYNMYFIKDL